MANTPANILFIVSPFRKGMTLQRLPVFFGGESVLWFSAY
jgi:hypothetical protein